MALQATYKRGPYIQVTLYNGSGANLNVGDLVMDDGSNNIQALTDGSNFLGVCHEDIDNGDTGYVEIPCGAVYEIDLATGYNPGYLDDVVAAGSGEFDGGSGGEMVAGYIIDIDPSSGGTARAMLISEKFNVATV